MELTVPFQVAEELMAIFTDAMVELHRSLLSLVLIVLPQRLLHLFQQFTLYLLLSILLYRLTLCLYLLLSQSKLLYAHLFLRTLDLMRCEPIIFAIAFIAEGALN